MVPNPRIDSARRGNGKATVRPFAEYRSRLFSARAIRRRFLETWQYFSLLAKALHAKSKLQLGDTEAAAGEFREVQKEFTRLLELGEGRMNPDWTAQAVLHATLAETEPLIWPAGDDSSASVSKTRAGNSAHSDSSTKPGGVKPHLP